MKNLRIVFLVAIVLMLAQNVEAQFLKRLAKHAQDKIEQEADRRAQKKVDEKIDEGYDKVEQKMERDRRKSKRETTQATPTQPKRQTEQKPIHHFSPGFPTQELKAGSFATDPYPLVIPAGRKLKRYAIRSGIVQYEKTISGKVLTSTVEGSGAGVLYFQDWGAEELNEDVVQQTTISKFFGKKKEETTNTHSMARLNNGEVHTVDFEQQKIYLGRDPAMDRIRETDSDAGVIGEQMLESIGGKKVGKAQFLGYNCDVWEVPGGTQLLYKGVLLKLDVTVMGIHTVQVATSAKFNTSVPARYFRLPDYPVIKSDDLIGH